MTDRLDNEFRFHQSALALRAERQQLLASNIANADTPNFKARDIDFRKALVQALGGAQRMSSADFVAPVSTLAAVAPGLALAPSHPDHLSASSASGISTAGATTAGSTAFGAELLYRMPRQDSIDGNTVELDAERAQFADNAVRYEASISAVNSKLKSLLAVISGQ